MKKSLFLLTSLLLSPCITKTIAPTDELIKQLKSDGLYYGRLNNLTSIAQFDKAVASNVYIFVKVGADWCGPCRSMEPIIKQLASEYTTVLFIEVNFDSFKSLAQRYGIKSIPTMLFFNDGRLINRAVGSHPKSYWDSLIKSSFAL